jgi:hypothetical protein
MSQKSNVQPGMMAHPCNPSYSGGRHLEDHGSRQVWAKKKKVSETPSQSIKWTWWDMPVIPVTQKAIDSRITV